MSDLLYRLGQRALGQLPRVQPLLRPGRDAQSAAPVVEEDFAAPEISPDAVAAPRPHREAAPSEGPAAERASSPPNPGLDEVIARIFDDRHREARPSQPTGFLPRTPNTDPSEAAPWTRSGTDNGRPRETASETPQPEAASPNQPTLAPREPQTRPFAQREPKRMPAPPLAAAERESARNELAISIGRIEVHAASPVAPAVAASRRAAPLSLEDYLARRRGGRP